MTTKPLNSLIVVVDDADKAPYIKARQLRATNLLAIKLGDDQFALIKADKSPNRLFVMSHFSEPITLKTLTRYIAANLS